jgi:uncharacterized small protein (DUF1192 family)
MDIPSALMSLCPEAEFAIRDGVLEWLSPDIAQPTDAEIQAEIVRLQADYEAKQYQRDRAAEYPPVTDYLDGMVKGDTAQVQAYIDACLAVKAKYPKPE